TALANPGGETPHPHTEEDWDSWSAKTLAQPAFSRVVELGRDLFAIHPYRKFNAQQLWIWRQRDWEPLYLSSSTFEHKGPVFDRLAEIVPHEKLDIWDGLVMSDFDFDRIHAFCRWLPAKYSEVLRDHFNHPDRDWAACAYQNYLAKTAEP